MSGGHGFNQIHRHGNSVGLLVNFLNYWVNSYWVHAGVNVFSNVAMTTSFLGVTLGLFDFFADTLKRENHRWGRFQTALLTFAPPLVFAFIYPQGFIMALGYAAVCVAFLEVLLPTLMVIKIRRSATLNSPYQVFGGNLLLGLFFILGLLMIFVTLYESI